MATSDFQVIAATASSTDKTPVATWVTDAALTSGFTSGVLPHAKFNRALESVSVISAMIGQFIVDKTSQNAVDDGTITTLLANFKTAVGNTTFPSGTRSLFAQATAPVGWVQDTTNTDCMLRVVNDGTGYGTGGSASPITMNVVPAHTHNYSSTSGNNNVDHYHAVNINTGGQSQGHTHGDNGHTHPYTIWSSWQPQSGSATPCWYSTSTSTTGTGYANLAANNVDHYHSVSGNTGNTNNTNHTHTVGGTTDNGSSSTTWYPKYLNIIVCQKT